MLTFTEADHQYKWNGIKTPSVSEILQASGVSDFSHIPEHKREAGMHFGRVIHRTCELFDKNDLDIDFIVDADALNDIKVMPYLDGWMKFRKESGCEIVSIEEKFYSRRGFAGRHDRVIKMPGLTMLDIKMSVDARGGTDLQLAAYALLWDENYPDKKIKNRIAVRLTPNNYQIIPYRNKSDRNDFLTCLNMYNLKKKRGVL